MDEWTAMTGTKYKMSSHFESYLELEFKTCKAAIARLNGAVSGHGHLTVDLHSAAILRQRGWFIEVRCPSASPTRVKNSKTKYKQVVSSTASYMAAWL